MTSSTVWSRAREDQGSWPPGFVALYHGHYARMVRLSRLLTGREDVAEDLVQDSFLRLADRWARVDTPAAYLRTSVVNASRSWLRRAVVERRHVERQRPLPAGPPEVHGLWEELGRLSPRRRAAVVLRYYEDLDDHEIADILRCRPATVRSLVHRALRQLEEVLS